MENIKVITGNVQAEIIEKKSRFIANAFEIHSEKEALAILERSRKKYYDAKHNCYAYVAGIHNELARFSDDKEPQGTAGKPILEVITNMGFCNTMIVVTRYFGGILLGTGGLVRAYSESARQSLLQAEAHGIAHTLFRGTPVSINCDYSFSGKVQYMISQMNIPLEDTVYASDVTFKTVVNSAETDSFIKKITEATNASSVINCGTTAFYIITDLGPVPYSV